MSAKITDVQMEESWKQVLEAEFRQPYFAAIKQFLVQEKAAGKVIYPKGGLIFNAFNTTPFNEVKIVILGQDPYHNPNQAMGLSFSVPQGVAVPASLKNIYKELASNIQGFQIPTHGDLTGWAKQGVFLLNAMLTVEQNKAGSHKNAGWQQFTDAVIQQISKEKTGVIFMLWGNFAKNKKILIDTNKHYVLEAAHPSPLAGNAFSGCRHFAKANEILIKNGQVPINWQV